METIEKIDVRKMKTDIKVLVGEQLFLKNQRQPVKLVGERKLADWVAASKYKENSLKLRCMYAAYGLARDKKYSVTENHYPEENHPLHQFDYKIEKIQKEYTIQVEVQTVE